MSFGRSVARKILGGLFGAVLLMSTMDSAGAISLNPITAIKSAVEAAVEERSADDIGTDLKLKTKIVAEVFDKMIDDDLCFRRRGVTRGQKVHANLAKIRLSVSLHARRSTLCRGRKSGVTESLAKGFHRRVDAACQI